MKKKDKKKQGAKQAPSKKKHNFKRKAEAALAAQGDSEAGLIPHGYAPIRTCDLFNFRARIVAVLEPFEKQLCVSRGCRQSVHVPAANVESIYLQQPPSKEHPNQGFGPRFAN